MNHKKEKKKQFFGITLHSRDDIFPWLDEIRGDFIDSVA